MEKNTQNQHHDLIAPILSGLIHFIKTHKRGVLTALFILALAIIIGAAYTNRQQKQAQDSWASFYNAQVKLMTAGPTEGFKLFDQLSQQYPGTTAALYSQLLKGDLLYAQEQYAQAADAYKPLLLAKNMAIVTPAALSLAASYQAMKDYPAATQVLQDFIAKNPTSFALPQAYFTLALTQELDNKKEDAIKNYQYLLENHTKSYYGSFAKDKLNTLKK